VGHHGGHGMMAAPMVHCVVVATINIFLCVFVRKMKSYSVIFESVSLFITYIIVQIPSYLGLRGKSLFRTSDFCSLLDGTFLYKLPNLSNSIKYITLSLHFC
jgi:hypothetical protein